MFPALCLPVGVRYEKYEDAIRDDHKIKKKAAERELNDARRKAEVKKNEIDEELKKRLSVLRLPLEGEGSNPEMEEDCPICYLPLRGPSGPVGHGYDDDAHRKEVDRLSACGHIFHTNCIAKWVQEDQSLCPTCRTPVDLKDAQSFRKLRPNLSASIYSHLPGGYTRPPEDPNDFLDLSDEQVDTFMARLRQMGTHQIAPSVFNLLVLELRDERRRWVVGGVVNKVLEALVAVATSTDPQLLQDSGALRLIMTPLLGAMGPMPQEVMSTMGSNGVWHLIFGHSPVAEVDAALLSIMKVGTVQALTQNRDAQSIYTVERNPVLAMNFYSLLRDLRHVRTVDDDGNTSGAGPSAGGVIAALHELGRRGITDAAGFFMYTWCTDDDSEIRMLASSLPDEFDNIFKFWYTENPPSRNRIECLKALLQIRSTNVNGTPVLQLSQDKQDDAFRTMAEDLQSFRGFSPQQDALPQVVWASRSALVSEFLAMLPGISSNAQLLVLESYLNHRDVFDAITMANGWHLSQGDVVDLLHTTVRWQLNNLQVTDAGRIDAVFRLGQPPEDDIKHAVGEAFWVDGAERVIRSLWSRMTPTSKRSAIEYFFWKIEAYVNEKGRWPPRGVFEQTMFETRDGMTQEILSDLFWTDQDTYKQVRNRWDPLWGSFEWRMMDTDEFSIDTDADTDTE